MKQLYVPKMDSFDEALTYVASRATERDQEFHWPAEELEALARFGAMKWAVPREFGGEGLSPLEIHLKYEAVARASLAVALILTQRDSAVGFINAAREWPLRDRYLRRLARNELMMTVGIAQLTTSRQGGSPALRATHHEGAWFLNGAIPWSTGPGMSPFIIGAAVAQEGQIIFALEQHASGVEIEDYMDLAALRATLTTSLTLKNVTLDEKWVLRGPVENALANRPGSLALGQTFLGLGLCRSALDLIEQHDSAAARGAHQRLVKQFESIQSEILELCAPGRESKATAAAPGIRGRLNDLTIRTTHAAVTLYKGSALLSTHNAQRLAREAMFMLVWSCPNPVIDSTVDILSSG